MVLCVAVVVCGIMMVVVGPDVVGTTVVVVVGSVNKSEYERWISKELHLSRKPAKEFKTMKGSAHRFQRSQ